jgi:hypothetical protein
MGNFTKVNDQRVRDFILWSQTKARDALWQNGQTAPSVIDVNFWAWRLLKEGVRGGRLLKAEEAHQYDYDYDAAAAEHYMYIRFLAGKTGDPACSAAPTLYAAKKLLDQALGRLQSGQAQGGHPVLPSNPYIVAWGQRGVSDGLADYKKLSPASNFNLGGALGTLAGFSYSEGTANAIGSYAKRAGAILQSPYK